MSKSKKKKPANPSLTERVEKLPKKKQIYIIVGGAFMILIILVGALYFASDRFSDWGITPEEEVLAILRNNERKNNLDELYALEGKDAYTHLQYVVENGCHFEPGVPLFEVGRETVTTDDVCFYYYSNDMNKLYSNDNLTDAEILAAIEGVKRDFVITQELAGEDDGILFTGAYRDAELYGERSRAINEKTENYNQTHTKTVRGEQITMWFINNNLEPGMGVENAREITEEKMNALHEELTSGSITMLEAAERIARDMEHQAIDAAWQHNAYGAINSEDGFQVFTDPSHNEVLFSMKEGEISDVLLGTDFGNGEPFPAFYTIIHVTEISGDGQSLDDLYNNNQENYNFDVMNQ